MSLKVINILTFQKKRKTGKTTTINQRKTQKAVEVSNN